MLSHYASITLRTLARHRMYAAINLFGLAVGLAAALLILVYVRHETSYERHFPELERIFRIGQDSADPARQGPVRYTFVSQPMADLMRGQKDALGIQAVTRVERGRPALTRGGDPLYQEVAYVDPDFFRIFRFRYLAGDAETALATPDSLVLSERAARRFFGDEEPLGRTLTSSRGTVFRVTAVIAEPEGPSNVWADAYMSTAVPGLGAPLWINSNGPVFVLADPGVTAGELQRRLQSVVIPLVPEDVRRESNGIVLSAERLADTHLHSGRWDSLAEPPASAGTVYAMAGIALLLLGMAAINYTNLATARASLRTREVGLRKTVGAKRRQLILQFLGESVIVAAGGLVLALVLAEVTAARFADLVGIRLYASPWSDPVLMVGAVLLTLGVGIAGGAYPALYLSGIRPAAVLRAGKGGVGSAGRLRAFLVVVQFSAAVALGAATLVVLQQTRHAASADLGFDKDNRVVLRGIGHPDVRPQLDALRAELLRIPGIEAASASWMVPGGAGNMSRDLNRPGAPESDRVNAELYRSEHDFLPVLGVRLLAGRGFDPNRGEDLMRYGDGTDGPRVVSTILNATAVQRLGFATPEAALGQVLTTSDDAATATQLRVIGVVEDFRPRNARNALRPMHFVYGDPVYPYNFLLVKISPGADLPRLLAAVDATWRSMFPRIPVARGFLDQSIERLYDREWRMAGVLGAFAGLTIAIACLGLYALAAFEAERRTKEIGVRKVLGASVMDIVRLLAWKFSRPVLLANLVAWPLAWLAMSRWLSDFAFRIDLGPTPFLAAGLGSLLIAWVTVAGHAARVARERPVRALRYE